MIHINLLEEKEDRTGAYALHILVMGVTMLLAVGGCFVFQTTVSTQLEELSVEKRTLTSELTRLKKITKRVEGLEENKKLLKQKLVTIATLKAKKKGPVHILDDLSKALPERAWLSSVEQAAGTIEVVGIALDNITITRFMNTLTESDYFSEVELNQSNQFVEGKVKLQQFSLSVRVTTPLQKQLQGMEAKKAKSA